MVVFGVMFCLFSCFSPFLFRWNSLWFCVFNGFGCVVINSGRGFAFTS